MQKKDLRQMKDSKKSGLTKDEIIEAAKKADPNADLSKIDTGDIKSVEDTVARYENKSESELIGELGEALRSGRKDGTFSDEMLDSFAKRVSPMMDAAQRKKLDSIIKMIKDKKI